MRNETTEQNSRLHPLDVINFIGAFVAFCVGSGFASGQEILQFFTVYGVFSFGALAICAVLFAWLGSTLMVAGYNLKLKSTNEIFKHYCGPYLGAFFEAFVPFFLFCVFVIMIAGAGATLSEYYGMPSYAGRVMMALLSLATILLGLRRMIRVIGWIGPMIILFSLLIGVLGVLYNPDGLKAIPENFAKLDPIKLQGLKASPSWWQAGILYAAYIVLGSAPFFAGMGTEARSRKDALWGGILGGGTLILIAALLSTGMLANMELIYVKEIPTLAIADKALPALGVFFSLILLAGIYTTAAPMLWSVCNRFSVDGTPKFKIIACVATVVAYFGGGLPFGKLVGTIYPYTGYLGIFFLLCMFYHQLVKGKKTA